MRDKFLLFVISLFSALILTGCGHTNPAVVNHQYDNYSYENSRSAYITTDSTYRYSKSNGSYGGSSSYGSSYNLKPISYSKPIFVKGYFRKNGTYVRPHTRSYPRRR